LNKFDYLYLKGLLANKFKSNNKEAIRFFSLANDLGSADAGLSLYLSTKDRINAKTALQYLQVSADRGNIEASVLFWKVLVLGSDITTEQGMLGVKYLEQAASMGNSESIELLLNDASRFLNKSQHNYWSLIFELYYQNIEEKDVFSINEIYDWSDFCQRFKRFDPEITENRKALNKRNLMILGQLVNGCFKKNK
jgi:TPR repeat protein